MGAERALVVRPGDGHRVANVEFLATDDGKVCPLCIANEEQGPIPIDAEFEHGAPPVHPRCRCALLPALDPLEG